MKRIDALESLRGLLAIWVLMGHVVDRIYTNAELSRAHLSLLSQPILAVYVFIILSGFVIMLLLDHEPMTYAAFVCRRFFRLAPLYLTVLAASAMTLGWRHGVVAHFPWFTPESAAHDLRLTEAAQTHFWPEFAAHVLMLQGLCDHWLPLSDYTFVGQGWSISLEWQFYLVAPLIFWLIRSRRWLSVSAIAVAAFGLYKLNQGVGFIGSQFGYFAIGIASYFAFKYSDGAQWDISAFDLAAIVACAVLIFFLSSPWALMAWALVLATTVAKGSGVLGPITALVSNCLELPLLRWLGAISYSIYLIHGLAISAAMSVVADYLPGLAKLEAAAAVLALTLGLTLAVSTLTHRFIERPGIRIGRRLATRSAISKRPEQLSPSGPTIAA